MTKIEHRENEDSSLRAKVFNQIQNDILDGKYKPGESLIETRLSYQLGVSRTPIREAIKQLELEGLVRTIPNKGAIVTGITVQDIDDIYTIRRMVEGLAARWAAEKITQEELEDLNEAVDLEEFYTKRSNVAHLLELDSRFHDIIYKASKSRPLMRVLKSFHHYVQRARNASLKSPGRAQKVLEEHKAILQAIMNKDPGKAERLTVEHIRKASLSLIKQKKNAGG